MTLFRISFSHTYRNKARKSLAFNPKFQNKTFSAEGILAQDVLYQGLGDMDLVANVMLGNSPTPQKGAPVGRAAGSSFAALLPSNEAAGAKGDAHSGASNGSAAAKEAKTSLQGKLVNDASQLAALAVPVFIPQLAETLKTADVSGQGAPSTKSESSRNVSDTTSSIPILDLSANGLNLRELLNVPIAATNKKAEGESPEKPTKEVAADAKALKATVLGPDIASKMSARIEKTPADKGQATAKPDAAAQKQAEAKAPKIPGVGEAKIAAQPDAGAPPASAATKSLHAVESLAGSAVKIALKQTLPAQSKIAGAVAKAAVPTARAFAAGQHIADAHATQNSGSRVTAPSDEKENDQPRKQSNTTVANPAVDQPSAHDQVNAVGRVLSSNPAAVNPRQVLSSASAPISAPPKQEAPITETPVLPGSTVALHSARLLESFGQSELRVGMKMGDLGNVEIRTQLHHDQLRAEISVERSDLGRTLATELPALQQKLHEHDVQATIVVNHHAAAGSGSFERGSQQQQQTTTPMAHVFGVEPLISSSSPEETRAADSGLDVRI